MKKLLPNSSQGTLEKQKGPPVSWNWRSQDPYFSKRVGTLHIWPRVRESNLGYTGGRRVLSQLCQPCSLYFNISTISNVHFYKIQQFCSHYMWQRERIWSKGNKLAPETDHLIKSLIQSTKKSGHINHYTTMPPIADVPNIIYIFCFRGGGGVLRNCDSVAMVTYSFHLYSRSLRHFILCFIPFTG